MRLDVVDRLGLTGEERVAGLATGAGYPEALAPIVEALSGCRGTVVDVGAGLGAPATHLARTAGVSVTGVEPEARVARRAGSAFPEVTMIAGTAERIPIADDAAAAVTLLGAVSLIEDLDTALREATRVVGRGATIGITDLCLADGDDELRSDPNVFRSPAAISAALAAHGWVDVSVTTAPADGETGWDDITATVDDAVEARYGDTEAGQAWLDDRQRLRDLIESGRLLVATLTARRSPSKHGA